MLWHNSLSKDNIFVDEDGNFTGTVDWQDQPLLPLWDVCQFPVFLQQAYDRVEEIQWDRYAISSIGIVHPLAKQDQERAELTALRRLYIRTMKDECELFIKTMIDNESKNAREFETAISNCTLEFRADMLASWVEAKMQGHETPRLYEKFME
ncbi:hypothetical protein GGR57DRAFT_449806 [Xylariaceae sp. FL1272]|nr:hypothetical protein GGR57DRAFT_449806 [Xylariaceae sp. FL1272]